MRINILTEARVREIIADEVRKRIQKVADEILDELTMRLPEAGPKILGDDEPVHMLGLSWRLSNVLTNENISTIGQLCALSPNRLFKFRNFGKATFIELQTRLARNGRKLSGA